MKIIKKTEKILAIPESLRYNNKRKENVFRNGDTGGEGERPSVSDLSRKDGRCTGEKKESVYRTGFPHGGYHK